MITRVYITETDVVNVLDDIIIIKYLDNPVQVLFLDLLTSFDHSILKIRLINIGITGLALNS